MLGFQRERQNGNISVSLHYRQKPHTS